MIFELANKELLQIVGEFLPFQFGLRALPHKL